MARPVRPGWLTAVAVLSIVLGSLGLLSSVVGVLYQLFGPQMQEWFQGLVAAQLKGAGMPGDALELQQEMMEMMVSVQKRWRTVMLVLSTFNMVISGLLIAGGLGTLRLRSWGRKLLIAALAATIVYEIALAIPTALIQRDSQQVSQRFTAKLIAAQQKAAPGGAPAAPPPNLQIFTNIGMAVGIVMMLGWLLVKLVLYGAAILYLNKPLIRSLFHNERGAAEVRPIEP